VCRVEVQNIVADIPVQLPNELFSTLLQNSQFKVERIVSKGHCNAQDEWYEQSDAEWVFLFQGAAILEFAEPYELKKLNAGDYLLIPAYCKHRVDWTDPKQESIWLALHFKEIETI